MPRAGMMWRHVIISTRRSWLHGDQRGFRTRGHRIHSSGDYRNPPPADEHAGLRAYHRGRARGEAVEIPRTLREEMLRVLLGAVGASGVRVLVIAVSRKHAHLLVELPKDRKRVNRIVGKWKSARSPTIRATLRGSVWGEGGKFKPVRTRAHQLRVYGYIRDDQGPGARVWTVKDGILPPKNPKPRAQRSGAPDPPPKESN